MTTIGVVFGGPSAEHEVTLATAKGVLSCFESFDEYTAVPIGISKNVTWYVGEGALDALIKQANKDMVFIDADENSPDAVELYSPPLKDIEECDYILLLTHGEFGEDGVLQGFFETLGKDIIGCGARSSTICYDKALLKTVLESKGYKVTPGRNVPLNQTEITEDFYDKLCSDLGGTKLFVKPNDRGSSVGVAPANNFEEFKSAMNAAGQYSNNILVERYIEHREIGVGLIGQGDDIIMSDLGEVAMDDDESFDYEHKYKNDNKVFICPAKIDEDLGNEIKRLALEIFNATECRGWTRIDFFIEEGTNEIFLNEINTIPGMAEKSVYPKSFQHKGLDYASVVKTVLDISTKGSGQTQGLKKAS